jgi:hypothetical protein
MRKRDLKAILREKSGYLKSGARRVANLFEVDEAKAAKAIREVRNELKKEEQELESDFQKLDSLIDPGLYEDSLDEWKQFLSWKKRKDNRVETKKRKSFPPYTQGDKDNVLIIGDLHEPFCLHNYLSFCREQQEKYNCGTVVFIGDIIDNHYTSYHESELDTLGPNEEFEIAKNKIQEWYKVFPQAWVTIGNHDRMVHRKCKTLGISSKWIKDYDDALDTPGWKFVDEIILNGVCYNHGEGGTARARMKSELMSQIQGHLHSQAYIEYTIGPNHKVFGAQIGCGIDRTKYAFAYGKNEKKPFIGCAVVLNKGNMPLLVAMDM